MQIKNLLRHLRYTSLAALCLFCISVSFNIATAADNQPNNMKATEQFQVGSMYVERHGDQGSPLILLPGLGSGAWVWDATVKQLEKDHTLYVVTLAGFNGHPAIGGPMMEQTRQSLLELINSRKLDKPVLIGHSLGATLSIWFAQQYSDKINGVFAVEGLPVFPGTENMPAEQRSAMAQGIKAQMAGITAEAFAAQQLQYMRNIGVIDDKLAQNIAALSSKSDPTATIEYMSEIMAMDIRKDMAAIKVPLMEISPYHAPDFASRNISAEGKKAYYASLLQGPAQLQVVPISGARHFVMLDQPKIFAEVLQNYLETIH